MIRRQRDLRPWRNVRPLAPLPEQHPDRWQWRAGEVVFGPDPRQLPAGWRPLLADLDRRVDDSTEATNG
jgi:hypothetical protein